MAKLLKQFGASLRPKTHDVDDTAMRERGATGVFRNMAFQEASEECIASSSGKGSTTSMGAKRNSVFAMAEKEKDLCSEKGSASSPRGASPLGSSPRGTDCGEQTATAWAAPPLTPSAINIVKRGSHQGCSTPRSSQRLPSSAKRPKNATEVEAIASPRPVWEADSEVATNTADDIEPAASDDGAQVVPAVAHWTRSSMCNFTRSNATSVRSWEEEVKRLVTAGRHEDAVRWTAPSDGVIHCTVRRLKNFLGNTVAYHLFLESGDTFLLAARQRKKSKTSNYVLSTSQEELGKGSSHCIAKLRANFVGTEYSLVSRAGSATTTHGSGASNDGDQSPTSSSSHRPPAAPTTTGAFGQEEMAVHYKQTVLTAKGGPRVMLIATPLPESNWGPCAADGSDSLPNCLEAARRRELAPRLERQLCMLATRPPEWDSALKSYTLDFHGRVRASSVKNFQLVHWDHNTDRKGSDLVLQFGKMDEGSEDFALDFTYPLTLQKAFAIALASTDSKLCYAM